MVRIKTLSAQIQGASLIVKLKFWQWLQLIVLIVIFISLSACAVISNKPYVDKDRVIIPPSSASVSALLEKAHQYRLANHYQQSLSTLERAIRIEPGDPVPWYRGAQVHFFSKDYDQAIVFAQRAASLSAAYPSLHRGCWRLIAKNHQALGKIEQAQLANQKAKTL